MSSDEKSEKVQAFVDAFEEVFDRDWNYSKQMLGIRKQTKEEMESDAKLGIEIIPIIADDGTFIYPRVEDETEDWGNRGRLLAAYRALKEVLQSR